MTALTDPTLPPGSSSSRPVKGRFRRRTLPAVAGSALGLILALLPVTAAAPTAAAATVGAAAATAVAPAATCTPDPVVCPPGMYFGASLPGLPRNLTALSAFGTRMGQQPTVADYFAAFGDQLDSTGMSTLAADHRLPMVTWSPTVAGATGNPYPLTSIATGTYDTYLRAQAAKLATIPGKVAVRLAHEMNGSWYPWGRGVNGNTDAQYVAAFQHVHDVVTAAGATNVIWVWAPGVKTGPVDLAGLYPGDAYVDWVGLDAYFDHPTDTFARLVAPTLTNIDTFAGAKPLFVAESGVLPGPNRPAQIIDLVGGMLRTPRMVGLSWFEEYGRYDWRVSADPAAADALAAALATPWVVSAGATTPVQAPPMNQVPPAVTGVAAVGAYLTASAGTWRSGPDTGGQAALTGRWYRCPDAVATLACTPVWGGTRPSYTPAPYDWGYYLSYRVSATNTVGASEAWSPPTGSIIVRPAAPTSLPITSSATALKVTLPAGGYGITHWQLTVNGKAYPPIPVGTTTHWLTGLTTGATYTVSLAAADLTTTDSRYSAPLTSTAVPMTGPSTPYVVTTGATSVFTLPRVTPIGAAAWMVTLDGQSTTVPLTAATWTSPTLTTGTRHTWSFAPVAGAGPNGGFGSTGSASSSTLVPLDTPPAPTITPVSGGATFTYPALPPGATGWALTVGPTTYPVTAAAVSTVTGLASGYSASWSLRAVNVTSRSQTVSGRFVPA